MKTLYNLHIPKCGGKGFQNLIPILEKNNLPVFTRESKNFINYSDYVYVNVHYGSDPMDKNPSGDTSCLFRDPLDRLVSQFAWAKMTGEYFKAFPKYENGTTEELLKHFLFDDVQLSANNNLQTKFVCNPISSAIFKILNSHPSFSEEESEQLQFFANQGNIESSWYIFDDRTSLDYAKQQIDKMTIIDTIENYDRYVSNVCNWFKENYGLDIEQEFRDSLVTENPTFNYSIFTDSEGIEWTTSKLKALLTADEIAKVYENNALDLEVYNYVKSKIA
jgi:hypothetical protein